MTAEYFDLYDGDGHPLGTTKARDQVHRDGDWHRSVALWIVRARGTVVVQRRSPSKDTYPGAFTASVSGHYAAGERLEQVLREAREEIGVEASAADLVPVCTWADDDRPAPGIVDRELLDVYLWPLERELGSFSPEPAEVMGLAEIDLSAFDDLLSGARPVIKGTWLPAGGTSAAPIDLTAGDFVPMAKYHRHVVRFALAYLARLNSPGSALPDPCVQSLTYGESGSDTA